MGKHEIDDAISAKDFCISLLYELFYEEIPEEPRISCGIIGILHAVIH